MREDIAGLRRDINGLRQEMKEEIGGLRQEMKEDSAALRQELRFGLENMAQTFNNPTNAMNRSNNRYNSTDQQLGQLNTRVTKLENPDAV